MSDELPMPAAAPQQSVSPGALATPAERPAFRLRVTTFNDDLFDGLVTYVDLPGIAGHIGVLARHTPLLTLLAQGPLTLHPLDGPPRILPMAGGIAEAGPWGVTVLADLAGQDAADGGQMDAARQRAAARQTQSRLLPGAAAARARLDDELNLFFVRALRELRR